MSAACSFFLPSPSLSRCSSQGTHQQEKTSRLPFFWPTASARCSWAQCWWWMAVPCNNAAVWGAEMVVVPKRGRAAAPEPKLPPCLLHQVLPQELLGTILGMLPPRSAAQARLVCKEWNRVVLSQPANVAAPWCLVTCSLVTSEDDAGPRTLCWAFDPDSARWMKLPLPASPDSRYVRFSRYSCGHSGLIGFTEHEWGAPLTHYWIGNPLTSNWQRIACTLDEDSGPGEEAGSSSFYTVNELVVEASTGRYRIIQFRIREVEDAYSWTTHIYDSAARNWRQGATTVHSRLYCMTSCVANGLVYFLLVGDQDAFSFEVLGYNVEKDRFEQVMPAAEVACPDGNLSWATFQLFASQDGKQLGVVAGVASGQQLGDLDLDEDFEWPLDRICILRFDAAARCWVVDKKSQICIKDCEFAFQPLFGPALTASVVAHTSLNSKPGSHFFFSRHKDVNTLLIYQGGEGQGARWSPLPEPLDSSNLLDTRGCWRASIGTFLPRLDVQP